MQDFVWLQRSATKLLKNILIQPFTAYFRVYYKLYRRVLSLEAQSWFRIPSKRTTIAHGGIDRYLSQRMGCKGCFLIGFIWSSDDCLPPRSTLVQLSRVQMKLNRPGLPGLPFRNRNISSLTKDKNRILLISFKATQSIQFLPIP